MQILIARGGLIIALVLAGFWWDNQPGRAQEAAMSSRASGGTRDGVLVLKTGQLVEGRLSQTAGGYQVELPKGKFLVPFDRVQVAAKDRHAAYEQLKKLEPNPTPDFQVALARWCISWSLLKEARIELRDALIADPAHDEALRMYARLKQLTEPKQAVAPQRPRKTDDGFESSAAESLAGLSPELAKHYVIRVQPLLLNRCGNAACHGPTAGQDFRITHVRRGLNQQTGENLSAVLKLLDLSSPEDSPLLKTLSGTHGRNGRPIFYGKIGQQNLDTLKDWITEVAAEQNDGTEEKPASNVFVRRDPFEEEPDETLIRGVPEEAKPLTPEQRAEQAKEDLLDAILQNERPDAFDPEEFNRKYGS